VTGRRTGTVDEGWETTIKLSIVVPVHNVAAYLAECLDSVLARSTSDYEVIAVDDCSPDTSGEILDGYAARDNRITVVHLDHNVGLGQARNIGMQHATGDYIAFLDSDDAYTPHAVRMIMSRLEATDRPDVLIVDHARTFWDGAEQPSPHGKLLAGLAERRFTAEEHPEIFTLLQVAWNKVYRRDFLAQLGVTFPSGFYEDTAWTHVTLLSAGSIATLPVVCVRYRQRRHGSILSTPSRRHFDAFDQWQRLFDHLDAHPELEHWRPLLAQRAVDHYVSVLTLPRRVPPQDRGDFYRRARALARANYADSVPRRHLKSRLLTSVSLPAFDLVHRVWTWGVRTRGVAGSVRRAGRAVGRRLTRLGGNGLRLVNYHRLLRKPLDANLAVFSALWDRGVTGNPAAIYRKMQEVAPEVRGVWVVRSDHLDQVPPGVDVVAPLSRRYFDVLARATYFVNDVNFPDYLVKRPGQVHLQTQHGTPLKHMGLDLMAHPLAARGMNFTKLLARADRWDYNVSSNPFSTLIWQRAFPAGFTTLEAGYPRNDVLVNATADDVAAARRELGLNDGQMAVLFAPTHRDTDAELTLRADVVALSEALGREVVLLVRAHYYYRLMPELDALTAARVVNVSRHPQVERLMLAADVLVTDYSSIMFDYANLDRPIVCFVPDWEEYRSVRGVYFDLLASPPGVVATDPDDLVDVFRTGSHDSSAAAAARRAFRAEFCTFDDGRAAERVCRIVFRSEPTLPMIQLEDRVAPPRVRSATSR